VSSAPAAHSNTTTDGSVGINLISGANLPTLHFHDDESKSLMQGSASYSWGGEGTSILRPPRRHLLTFILQNSYSASDSMPASCARHSRHPCSSLILRDKTSRRIRPCFSTTTRSTIFLLVHPSLLTGDRGHNLSASERPHPNAATDTADVILSSTRAFHRLRHPRQRPRHGPHSWLASRILLVRLATPHRISSHTHWRSLSCRTYPTRSRAWLMLTANGHRGSRRVESASSRAQEYTLLAGRESLRRKASAQGD